MKAKLSQKKRLNLLEFHSWGTRASDERPYIGDRKKMPKEKVLVFSDKDNVGTATEELAPGEFFLAKWKSGQELKTRETIPFGFKVALEDIPKGGDVIKYGEIIGRSIRLIQIGEMVHVHNIGGTRGRGDLKPGIDGKV